MNRVNQYSPLGSSTYAITGYNADGTPQYTQNTSLSPQMQSLFNTTVGNEQGAANAASGLLPSLQNAGNINTSNLPGITSTGLNPSWMQNGVSSVTNPSWTPDATGTVQNAANTPGITGSFSSASGTPNLQGYLQNAAGTPGLFGSFSSVAGTPGITGSVTNGAANPWAIQQAENAAYNTQMQYLAPQEAQQSQQLQGQLVNQGLQPGTEAYNNAWNLMQQGQTFANQSAQNAAVAAGQQEQNTLFGQGLSAANLQNAANQQGFGQGQALGQFGNAANLQGFNEGLASGQFTNAANQQGFNQGQALGTFQNAANAQGYGEGLSNAQLQNAANSQGYSQGLSNANLANSANLQGYNEGLSSANLQNSANAQALQQATALNQLPLQDYATLTGLSQPSMPTFSSVPSASIAPADLTGDVYNSYQGALNTYDAQMGAQNSMNSGLFSLAGAGLKAAPALYTAFSDERMKKDIEEIGETPGGHTLFAFNYKDKYAPLVFDLGGDPDRRQIGVMAQEVEKTQPEAVYRRPDGLRMVDYSRVR
jgi:hypothetical protein